VWKPALVGKVGARGDDRDVDGLGLRVLGSGGDSAAGSEATSKASCEGAPIVTWDNFGAGFLNENCDSCHASTVTDAARNDAPEAVSFDTKEEVWVWAEDILRMATGEQPQMPPEGGPSDDDRVRLFWWLGCGETGT
jgi:uncharacterized membrane protein